jgi:hypothetical protein
MTTSPKQATTSTHLSPTHLSPTTNIGTSYNAQSSSNSFDIRRYSASRLSDTRGSVGDDKSEEKEGTPAAASTSNTGMLGYRYGDRAPSRPGWNLYAGHSNERGADVPDEVIEDEEVIDAEMEVDESAEKDQLPSDGEDTAAAKVEEDHLDPSLRSTEKEGVKRKSRKAPVKKPKEETGATPRRRKRKFRYDDGRSSLILLKPSLQPLQIQPPHNRLLIGLP